MFKGGGWFMYVILAVIVVAMLRNAAGTVGIILAGGSESNAILGTLSGQGIKSNTGTFSAGGTNIKLG